jgi:hypothetical protein
MDTSEMKRLIEIYKQKLIDKEDLTNGNVVTTWGVDERGKLFLLKDENKRNKNLKKNWTKKSVLSSHASRFQQCCVLTGCRRKTMPAAEEKKTSRMCSDTRNGARVSSRVVFSIFVLSHQPDWLIELRRLTNLNSLKVFEFLFLQFSRMEKRLTAR